MDAEKAFALALLAVALYASLLVVWPFFTYVALAVFLAYALYPFQRRLAPRVGPRKSAVGLMTAATVLFVLPFVLMVQVVLQQALSVFERVQSGELDVGLMEEFLISDLGQDLLGAARSGAGRILEESVNVVGGASTAAVGVTILGFLLYYLLVGGEDAVAWFRDVTPLPTAVQDRLLADLDRLTYAVLVTQGVIAVVQAVLTGLALAVLGFSNVLFWTAFAVVLGLLPFVGSMFVWIPAAVLLIATGRPLAGAGLLVYGFGVINLTDNYLRPVLGGRSANLNPAILVVGIFGGLVVFGFTGIFVGPIVLGFTKTVVAVVADEYA
ncbi:AI-2E family transporter [Halorussus gelatinilyticus]|uniref:AI-2E family transporter n=1 Tax=Halorussus gelatinilyticus TaxID=2937524 RepID=A0A8U0IDJ8_9EURY|nr:AI-2E family transporter [Halorussus gelatinilyticus]UPV98795.1 AI-2E family transporter [Halorussus gelatinilyticus]